MTWGYGSWFVCIADLRKHTADKNGLRGRVMSRSWNKLDANKAVKEVRQQMRAEQKGE